VALALVAGVGGVVLWQGLSNATLYFCNADEVGQRSACTSDKHFRLQGTVVPGSVVDQPDGLDFDVTYGGVVVPVHHQGDAPTLFQEDIPVVLEGRYDGTSFASDRILVKHSEEYKAANPDRVPDGAP
jgi:cytochrome c-type biogenesis protein CcmE